MNKNFKLETVNLVIDKHDAESLYGIMKQIFASKIITAESFECNCRSCNKKIEMRNFGLGWSPYEINSGKRHTCKEWKKIKQQEEKLRKLNKRKEKNKIE